MLSADSDCCLRVYLKRIGCERLEQADRNVRLHLSLKIIRVKCFLLELN